MNSVAIRSTKFIPRLRPYFNGREILALFDFSEQLELEFKKALQDLVGCRHVFLFSYGRAALYSFLKANYPEPTTVITPAYNCTAVPYAIAQAGHSILLTDVSLKDANLDLHSLEKLRPPQGSVLVTAHMFGNTSPIAPIRKWANENGIQHIIADAALALLSYENGKHIAQNADGAFLSFSTGKHLSTIEGGAFVTNDENLAHRIQEFQSRFMQRPSPLASIRKIAFLAAIYMTYQGHLYPVADFLYNRTPLLNFLLSGVRAEDVSLPRDLLNELLPLQLRIAKAQIQKLPAIQKIRGDLQSWYVKRLGTKILTNAYSADNILSHISLRVRDRSEFFRRARQFSIYLEGPLYDYSLASLPSLDPFRSPSQSEKPSAPNAERLAKEVINLPFYPQLNESDLSRLAAFLEASEDLFIHESV